MRAKSKKKKARPAKKVSLGTLPSFVCELPLVLDGGNKHVLEVRFETARQAYNAILGEALRRLDRMREAKAYQAARKLPHGTPGSAAARARSAAFRALNQRFQFDEHELQHWATEHISHAWLGQHLDSNTVQTLATRAFKATQQYAFGKILLANSTQAFRLKMS